MRDKISKEIIPLLISVALVMISIGTTLFTDVELNNKHYVGFGLVTISVLLYFKNIKCYVYFFVLTLLLGIMNLIDIFYWNLTFGIGPIKFNPIFLTLLIVFLILSQEMMKIKFPEKN